MELETLRLTNFRQFMGEQQIDFATGATKNVTLIHGENGVGKTTILNSILWCLFADLTGDFERPNELLCNEVKYTGGGMASVELWFNHEGESYLAQRGADSTGNATFRVFRITSGNYESVPNREAFINSILPREMAGYFFFHGEGISSISDTRRGEKFRRAIRDILGFSFAEQAESDLERIRSKYVNEAKELYKKNSDQEKAAKVRAEQEQRASELREEEKRLAKELADLEEREAGLVEALTAHSGGRVAEIKTGIKESRDRVARLEKRRAEVQAQRQDMIQRYGWAVCGHGALRDDLSFIDTSTFRGRVPAPYQDTFVQDLLEDGKCVCGRELREGTDEWNNVLALRESANTAAISQRLMKARSMASNGLELAQSFQSEVERVEGSRREIDRDLQEAQNELSKWENELNNVDEDEVARLNKERKQCREQMTVRTQRLGRVRSEAEDAEQRAAEAKRRVDASGTTDARIKRLNEGEALVDRLIKRIRGRLEEFEEGARRQLAHLVNEILRNFSRKNYEVRVNESFEFKLVRQDGGVVAKSRGENLLLNLSFVASLIGLAQQRERAQGDFLVQGTVAPFVIDAPFGELDETYKKATARFLPSTAKQLVVLVSSSHWKGAVEEALDGVVGREYILRSHRRDVREAKPEDHLTIRSKVYKQSIYEEDYDMTSVVEVEG